MESISKVTIQEGIGIVEINAPPVNALGAPVRTALHDHIGALAADSAVAAIVIHCGGRTFFAGADIGEFGKPFAEPTLGQLIERIELTSKPVVAAMHGTALGGGFELALACHYRIIAETGKVGLPEVHLGLLPGAGGTQRLPRLLGVEAALDLLTSGRSVGAAEALKLGLVDAIANPDGLLQQAVALARQAIAQPLPRVRERDSEIETARADPQLFDRYRERYAREFRGFRAPHAILRAVEAAVREPFDSGLAIEWKLFKELETSTESLAQRSHFFAERQTASIPDIPKNISVLPINTVGVVGAGTMGGGIAMGFLNAGLPVTLVEAGPEALERGMATIRRTYEASVRKGRLTALQAEERVALLHPTLDFETLGKCDLLIEAAFEEMAIKKTIFARFDEIARPGAILATNTSFLDLDEIAAATRRPESVVGLHFFSPAHVMRLLEVVRGAQTDPRVVATAMTLAKRIGKVPVLSGVCHGFIANRIMAKRSEQADQLVLEGPSPSEVDDVLQNFGFAMGHFAMMDLVGLDVIGRGVTERTVAGDLVAMGRLGQKQGGGYYDYDADRRPSASPVASQAIADVAKARGIAANQRYSAEEILTRLLYPVVNEGAKLLEEGIALRASDIDVAAVLGYNWPVYRGGPMFWADQIGLQRIVDRLEALEAQHGPAFTPARLLKEKANRGEVFTHG
nr:3-hydroxyacyl-CoA dehydrogenase NAD-binding domain-containing protein [Sphingomonas sp. CDS-1]